MDAAQLARWECYYPINFYDRLFITVMLPSNPESNPDPNP